MNPLRPFACGLRRFFCFGFLPGAAFILTPVIGSSAVIVPDVWYSAGSAGVAQEEGAIRFATNENTAGTGGIQHVLTYIEPVSLSNIGDSINVSLSFSAGSVGSVTTGHILGFAFYDSGGSRISANGLGQNNTLFSGYRGYRAATRTLADSGRPFEFRARSAGNNALGNTGTAHATSFGTSGPSTSVKFLADTLYHVDYGLTRTADGLDITFEITGGSLASYVGSWSVASTDSAFYTTFDTFAISLGSANVFSSLTISDVSITVVPEPATAATLLGVCAVALTLGARRRR